MAKVISCCYDYNNKQRIAFYAVGLGLALCIVGCASPFWMSGKVMAEEPAYQQLLQSLPRVDNILGETGTFKVNIGLWWYCIGLEGRERMCFAFPSHNVYATIVRMLMCACLLVSVIGLLVVCFYCSSCCANCHTLGYGLLFFFAGILGFGAVFILTFSVDVLPSLPQSHASFGWAFPVFLTGNCLIVFASIVLCITSSKKAKVKYETVIRG